MHVVRGVLFALAVIGIAVPAVASPPVFNGVLSDVPFTVPSGSTAVFWGDSITDGGHASTCSSGAKSAGNNSVATMTGACWDDLVSKNMNFSTEVVVAHSGGRLEHDNITGTGVVPSGIDSWQTDLKPYCTKNTYFFFGYGTNDVRLIENIGDETDINPNTYNPTTFINNYTTVIQGLESYCGVSSDHFILLGIYYEDPTHYWQGNVNAYNRNRIHGRLMAFNRAVAQTALNLNTRYVDTYAGMAYGDSSGNAGPALLDTDGLHPIDIGHTLIASLVQKASFTQAIGASIAYGIKAPEYNASSPFTHTDGVFETNYDVQKASGNVVPSSSGTAIIHNLSNSYKETNFVNTNPTRGTPDSTVAFDFREWNTTTQAGTQIASGTGTNGSSDLTKLVQPAWLARDGSFHLNAIGSAGSGGNLYVAGATQGTGVATFGGVSVGNGNVSNTSATAGLNFLTQCTSGTCGFAFNYNAGTAYNGFGTQVFDGGTVNFSHQTSSCLSYSANATQYCSTSANVVGPIASTGVITGATFSSPSGNPYSYINTNYGTTGGTVIINQNAGATENGGLIVRDGTASGWGPIQAGKGTFNTSVQAPNGAAASCAGGYTFVNGIMVITGAGVPTCTAPAASMYLRSDGTAGARIYISAGGGTWAAVAGV